jgi:hypothetical protein
MARVNYGPHIQGWTGETVRWCEIARPGAIKVVATQDGIDRLARWAADGWLREIVLRSDGYDYPVDLSGDLLAQARQTAKRNLDFARPFQAAGLGPLLLLEGCNEKAVGSPEEMALYAFHEAVRAEVIAGAGLRALTFQFPVGHPPTGYWREAVDKLYRIRSAGGALALHQYNQPALFSGPADMLAFRHERIYAQLPGDLRDLPLYITEFGIDGGVAYEGSPAPRPGEGWRSYTDEAGYLDQLRAAAPRLRQARAVFLFTFASPGGSWESFETQDAYEIARWIGSFRTRQETKEEPSSMPIPNLSSLLDLYVRSLSGVGYNPATALGKYYRANFARVGLPVTAEVDDTLEGEEIVYRVHLNGVLLYRKRDGAVDFLSVGDMFKGKRPFA